MVYRNNKATETHRSTPNFFYLELVLRVILNGA